MSRKKKTVKVIRKGKVVEIDIDVHLYNQRKRRERESLRKALRDTISNDS